MATKRDEYYERGRRRYIEEHAPLALPVATMLVPLRYDNSAEERRAQVVQETIALLGDLYDALPRGEEGVAEHVAPPIVGGAQLRDQPVQKRYDRCDPGPASEDQS